VNISTPPRRTTVAVAIPTYLREQTLVQTLEQVMMLDPLPDEVLVIDQSPAHQQATESYLNHRHQAGGLRWIRQETPNLPRARNRALLETSCDVVIFIDDDVILTPGFIDNHVRNYADTRVCAVAGRILEPDRTKSRPDGTVNSSISHLFDYLHFPLESTKRAEWIANFRGCNHSVRRERLLELGGYDEHYIGWAFREDTDAAIRLWKAGAKIIFDPDACLTHLAEPSGGCRITFLREWQVSFPATYFSFRHLYPKRRFWTDVLLRNVRFYVLRKSNVFRPWRLPWAFAQYLRSVGLSWWRARHFSCGSLQGDQTVPSRLPRQAVQSTTPGGSPQHDLGHKVS
jgi:GT2 family glycosyltransferase